MTSFSEASSVLSPSQLDAIRKLNRPVGKIKLYGLERLMREVRQLQEKKEIEIPSDGFRSVYTPDMLNAPMKKFLAPKVFRPDKRRLTAAVSHVRHIMKYMGVVAPLDLDVAHQRLLEGKEKKNAGLPTMGRKEDDTNALDRAKACWNGKCPPPAVIAHRGKNLEVARAVWMFPFEWHIVEAAFFFPLQEEMKAHVRTYASENGVERRARLNTLVATGRYQSKVAMDYSGYDASIGPQLIGIAFNLLKEHILFTNAKQEKVWDRIATYFSTCPAIDQHLKLVVGRRGGVPSGSMFTQMVDSVINALVIEYAFTEVAEKRYFVYGDDSLILLPNSVQETKSMMKRVCERALELGITVNLEKTHVCVPTDLTTFLGHYDLRRGRPLVEVLSRLIYPERPFEVTAASILDRLAAYLAESDEAAELIVPMWFVVRSEGLKYASEADISRVARSFSSGWTQVHMGGSNHSHNPRNLPGIQAYLATVDPTYADSYMRMRAAL